MPKKVSSIDKVLSIEGRGTVIAMPKQEQWEIPTDEVIHRRERVEIRTANGGCLSTFIKNIEFINQGRDNGSIAFTLPKSVKKDDIPCPCELWLERDGTEPILEP